MSKEIVLTLTIFAICMMGICKSVYARDPSIIGNPMYGTSAEDDRGYINVSIYGAGAFPSDDEDLDLENSAFIMGRLTYDVTKNVEVGIESGWINYDVEDLQFTVPGFLIVSVIPGNLTAIPIMGVLLLKYPIDATDNRLVPYLLGGLGAIIWIYDESPGLEAAGVDIDDQVSFAWKLGVGADYYLTDNIAVFAEGSYMFSEYGAGVSFAGFGSGKITTDINTAVIGGGLKYSF